VLNISEKQLHIYVWGFWESPCGSDPLIEGEGKPPRNPLTPWNRNMFTPDELIALILKIKDMQKKCVEYDG